MAVRAVEVDRRAPRCGVTVGEVRAKAAKVVARRAEVIVDHIEEDGQAARVAGIDQAFQPLRATVGVMGGVKVHAVIAPPPAPRELVDGHQLDVRDAEVDQVIEPRNGGLEGPGWGEGARHGVRTGRPRTEGLPASAGPARERPAAPTTRRGLWTPYGCHGERGSGSGSPPSRRKADPLPGLAAGTSVNHQPPSLAFRGMRSPPTCTSTLCAMSAQRETSSYIFSLPLTVGLWGPSRGDRPGGFPAIRRVAGQLTVPAVEKALVPELPLSNAPEGQPVVLVVTEYVQHELYQKQVLYQKGSPTGRKWAVL